MSKNHNPKYRHSPQSNEAKKTIDPNYIKSADGFLYLKEDILQLLRFIQQKIGSNKTKNFTVKDIELFLKSRYNAEKITLEQIDDSSYYNRYKYAKTQPALIGHEVEFITEGYVLDEYCVGVYQIKRNLTSQYRLAHEPKNVLIFLGSKDGIHGDYGQVFVLAGNGLHISKELAILCNAFPDLE